MLPSRKVIWLARDIYHFLIGDRSIFIHVVDFIHSPVSFVGGVTSDMVIHVVFSTLPSTVDYHCVRPLTQLPPGV